MSIPKMPFPQMVAERVSGMRGFAMRLSGNDHARAEDLMQDTIVNALANESSFILGTNIDSWLTTIMKNKSYSTYRKKREVEDPDGQHEAGLVAPTVESSEDGEAERIQKALELLPPEQREVLLLAANEGLKYSEIAQRMGIEEGTTKSRLNRARTRLSELLGSGKKMERTGVGYLRDSDGNLQIRNNDEKPGLRSFDVSSFNPVEPEGEVGCLPEMLWLRVSELRIDERYQRSVLGVGMTNIRHIAAHFRWNKFTAVCVARWEGTDYVVDGQHRTYAAALRGIEKVPCLVVRMSPAEAADAFAAINGRTTAIHALTVWGARVAAGDKEAVALDAACRAEGVQIKRYPVPLLKMRPGQTVALGVLQRGLKVHGETGLRLALRLLMTAHPGERGILSAPLLRTALGVVARFQEERPAQLVAAVRGINFTRTMLEQSPELTSVQRMDHAVASIVRQIRERMQ